MADITNQQVIKFCNEEVRPISEELVKIKVVVDDILNSWNATIQPIISGNTGTDVVIDGREQQGVTPLTKQDIVDLGSVLIDIQSLLNGASVDAAAINVANAISKPNVRSLAAIL